MKYGLSQQTIDSLNHVFVKYPTIKKVKIYGSRVKGNFKAGSDIDLSIFGDTDLSTLIKIENQIDDLLLPYKIDISIFHQIQNVELVSHINRIGEVFYENS